MPLTSLTLILPPAATRPDAVIIASLDATRPWLMSIEAVAPLPQAELDEAMRTLHAPSKVAAAAGVAAGTARRNKK